MSWKIWYDDETFSSEQGKAWDSPEWGTLVITQPGRERDVLWNDTYYIHWSDTDLWTAHDLIGFIDQQVHFSRYIDCVRIGRDTQTEGFKEILRIATIEARGQ